VEFEHVDNPYAYSTDKDVMRHNRYVVYAEQLEVLRVNLRGMQQRTDQLHPNNWNQLHHIRRSLADQFFEMSGRQGGRQIWGGHDDAESGCELALLEESVASLRRVGDLLQPAGTDHLYGVVGGAALIEAKSMLDVTIGRLRLAGADRPLTPSEWQQFAERPC